MSRDEQRYLDSLVALEQTARQQPKHRRDVPADSPPVKLRLIGWFSRREGERW